MTTKSNSQFIQNFSSAEDVINSYSAPADALKGAKMYLAWYGYGDYSGMSLVVFEKNKKLYEVNGSHCSCHGLEGQWEPEETSWEALQMRDYYDGSYEGSNDAHEILQSLCKKFLKNKKKTKK